MLLVNNASLDTMTPPQLTHAAWGEAPRLADLVFPWFLLCAGLSLPFSYASALRRGGYGAWLRRAGSRAFLLFLLGCFVDSAIGRRPVLGMGVLQLIALSGFVAAPLAPLSRRGRLGVALGLLALYAGLLALVPNPLYGRAVLTEAANTVAWWNARVLGPFAGTPSVVPGAALVLLGTVGGGLLGEGRRGELLWLGWGLALLGALASLAMVPTKIVWTPPYILLGAGSGLLPLAGLDRVLPGPRRWAAPLLLFGGNGLAAYVGPVLFKTLVFHAWTTREGRPLDEAYAAGMYAALGRYPGGWVVTLSAIAFAAGLLLWLRRRGLMLRL